MAMGAPEALGRSPGPDAQPAARHVCTQSSFPAAPSPRWPLSPCGAAVPASDDAALAECMSHTGTRRRPKHRLPARRRGLAASGIDARGTGGVPYRAPAVLFSVGAELGAACAGVMSWRAMVGASGDGTVACPTNGAAAVGWRRMAPPLGAWGRSGARRAHRRAGRWDGCMPNQRWCGGRMASRRACHARDGRSGAPRAPRASACRRAECTRRRVAPVRCAGLHLRLWAPHLGRRAGRWDWRLPRTAPPPPRRAVPGAKVEPPAHPLGAFTPAALRGTTIGPR